MKKIVAVSITDTHLKETNIEVNKSVWRQTIDICSKNKCPLLHFGDIFDKRKGIPDYLIQAFNEILDYAREKDVNIVAIKGNHDCTDYAGEISLLLAFKNHQSFNLIEDFGRVRLTPDFSFHLIPFYRESDTYEKYLQQCIEQNDFSSKINYLGTHVAIDKAQNNDGSLVDGLKHDLFDKFDKVFIGHYHDANNINDKFIYTGSSIQHNFGESPEKGCIAYFEDGDFDLIELDFPRFKKYEINVEDLTPKDIVALEKEISKSNDNIRIVLTGDKNKVKSFDKSILENLGVDCKPKYDEVRKSDVEQEFTPHSNSSIKQDFELFCQNNIYDVNKGLKYLNKVIC